ncbi:hypothetical protein Q3G72_021134 [Acer saccharum]|nr:hypothetical protein Q3G72_021134 [Acer saccharum]
MDGITLFILNFFHGFPYVFASHVTVGGDGEVDNHILENLVSPGTVSLFYIIIRRQVHCHQSKGLQMLYDGKLLMHLWLFMFLLLVLCLTVEIAEALIIFHGLRLARDAGICPILVKSDASTVVGYILHLYTQLLMCVLFEEREIGLHMLWLNMLCVDSKCDSYWIDELPSGINGMAIWY